MAKLVAKTYGSALFDVGIEKNMLTSLTKEVNVVVKILNQNPELKKLLIHPQIMVEEKQDVIKNIFEGKISEELFGFLRIIIQKGRQSELDSIFSYYIDAVKRYNQIGIVYVTTPLPLPQKQKRAVEARILETTDYKRLEIHYCQDASLIGGMLLRIGDRVVDSSIKNKLNNLARELTKIQLA